MIYAGAARAGDFETDRESLRGLNGVYVVVEDLPDRLQTLLSVDQIQTDAELRLRKVGIKVLYKKEWLETDGHPEFYVNVNIVSVDRTYSYSVSVEFNQDVLLARNKAKARCSTWSVMGVGQVGETNLRPRLREVIGDMIDRFANAYLTVNPMPRAH
jgi:hypothetical protein